MNPETTLVILKPPALSCGHVGALIAALENNQLRVHSIRSKRLNHTDLVRLYPHVTHMPFFAGLVELYTSEDCVVMFVKGENAIQRVRDLIGPTKNPPAGTLRYLYADPDVSHNNLIHASDSPEAFAAERLIFE